MLKSIPAAHIVSVTPSVLSSGGSSLSMNAVFLTKSDKISNDGVTEFSTAEAVGSTFGTMSDEYKAASVYFNGFDGSSIKPGTLFFAPYRTSDSPASLTGATVVNMTLDELKAVTGEISITVSGVNKKIKNVDLSAVTSFSEAAESIANQLGDLTGSFDSISKSFKFITAATGAGATITAATGAGAEALKLTEAAGAILSQGAQGVAGAAQVMLNVTNSTLNWVTFTTIWGATLDEKMAFAKWSNDQNNRFLFVGWGMEDEAIVKGNQNCFGMQLKKGDYSGACPVYGALDKGALICATAASIDFTEQQGRITFKFKGQSGLTADVTDQTVADILEGNGYNYYGAWATANDRFLFLAPGQMPGKWKWLDAFINQVRLNSQLQLALITLLTSAKAVPYNARGIALQRAACTDPINEALNFGSIQSGVSLSEQQKAIINNEAGIDAASSVETTGYYLLISPATAQTRGQRQSMPMKLWYTDGGSLHGINLPSINVQ